MGLLSQLGAAVLPVHDWFAAESVEERLPTAQAGPPMTAADFGFTKEATLKRRLPEKQGSELRDVNIWTMFRSELAGSPADAYGYTAYDALGRLIP